VEENADTEDSKTSNGQFREADVWTECIQLRKAVIHNDFNFMKKADRPEGIYRTMVVPVFRNQQVVAVLGLINKKTDYLETDVEIVNYLADVTWEVSEIKIKEDSLRESEETIRLLFNSTAEGIYGIDTFGNCTFCNKATLTLLGYTDEQELIGKNMHRLIHHSHQDGSIYHSKDCRIYNAFQKGVGSHVDDEVLWRKNGSSFPSEYWSYPIHRDGKIIGSVVTFLDITQRKHDEAVQQILYDVARTSMSAGTQESLLKTVRNEINKVMDASDFYVAYYHSETDTLQSLQTTDQTSEWKEWSAENSLSGQVVRSGKPLLLNKEEMIEYLSAHNLSEEKPAESWLGVPLLDGQKPIGVMVVQSQTNPKAYSASNARLLDIIAHEPVSYTHLTLPTN
jgi:PAS domain S-box-containing protein